MISLAPPRGVKNIPTMVPAEWVESEIPRVFDEQFDPAPQA